MMVSSRPTGGYRPGQSAGLLILLSVLSLFVPSYGPSFDHHFAEKQLNHAHIYLAEKIPNHRHGYESAHSHRHDSTKSPDGDSHHLEPGSDGIIIVPGLGGSTHEIVPGSAAAMHVSPALLHFGGNPLLSITINTKELLPNLYISPLTPPPRA